MIFFESTVFTLTTSLTMETDILAGKRKSDVNEGVVGVNMDERECGKFHGVCDENGGQQLSAHQWNLVSDNSKIPPSIHWNFRDRSDTSEFFRKIPEGPIYRATEEDMKNSHSLVQAVFDSKLWLDGPVKVIPPESYDLAVTENRATVGTFKLSEPWQTGVRKITKTVFQLAKLKEDGIQLTIDDNEDSSEEEKDEENSDDENSNPASATATSIPPLRRSERNATATVGRGRGRGRVGRRGRTGAARGASNTIKDAFYYTPPPPKRTKWTVAHIQKRGNLPQELEGMAKHELELVAWNVIRAAKERYGKRFSLYGSDQDKTISPTNVDYLSLAEFDGPLKDICDRYGLDYRGMATAYTYFGAWLTWFAFHVEDYDMWAINYLHEGAVKTWYGTGPAFFSRIQDLAVRLVEQSETLQQSTHGHKCKSPFREKTLLPDPEFFRQNNIPLVKHYQKPGEFIIVAPRVGHMGFNSGYNVAEALNFITKEWIFHGLTATNCTGGKCPKFEMIWFVYELLHNRFLEYLDGTLQLHDPEDTTKTKLITIPKPKLKVDTYEDQRNVLRSGIFSVLAVAQYEGQEIAFIFCDGKRMWLSRNDLKKCKWSEAKEFVVIPDSFYDFTTPKPPGIIIDGDIKQRKTSWPDEKQDDSIFKMVKNTVPDQGQSIDQLHDTTNPQQVQPRTAQSTSQDLDEFLDIHDGYQACEKTPKRKGPPISTTGYCVYCEKFLCYINSSTSRCNHIRTCSRKICPKCNQNYAKDVSITKHLKETCLAERNKKSLQCNKKLQNKTTPPKKKSVNMRIRKIKKTRCK